MSKKTQEHLRVNIRYLRRLHALSQRQLAELSGASLSAIERLESGKSVSMTVDTLLKIAATLGCRAAQLLP